MFKLGYRLLISRKSWFILLVTTIAIVLASIIAVSTASESIKIGLKEQAYSDYGEHTLVLLDSIESKETLNANGDIKKIGGIGIMGNIELRDEFIATVGTLDKQALEMGRIELLNGSFPNRENEVAIESSYLSLVDKNWKIGEKKILKINNKELELILSGIVKDYSAKWTVSNNVQKGVNDFPNIILSNKNKLEIESQNFLVRLNGNNGNIDSMQEKSSDFLVDHTGFINERLFYNGLTNYQEIAIISFVFQIIILLGSFVSMYCLFYFFNINQQRKLAVLKTVGSTNLNLLKLNLYQIFILLLIGLFLSLPLLYFLYVWIINNTFNISNLNLSNILYIIVIVVICIVGVFYITLHSSYLSINFIKDSSINTLLKEPHSNNIKTNKIPIKVNDFTMRKVLNQLQTKPKHSLLVILTLTLSILIINFSFFVEKESAGIWNTKIDYYLNSQEIYSYDVVNNLTVLHQEGLTFSPEVVYQLEEDPSIKYLEKTPFMVDVHPLLKKDLLNNAIKNWLIENNFSDVTYYDDYIIPNVRYVLVDESEFSKLYPNLVYEDLLGKVILYNPAYTQELDLNELNGEELTFIQKKKEDSSYKTKNWDFEILNMYNGPFTLEISESIDIQYTDFVVVMAEETAIDEGLFSGYNEISIYLEDQIGRKDIEQLESELSEIIALTPGSLYQKISTLIEDDKRISLFVGYLGKLAYLISVILSIVSTTVIIFSKYRMTKKEWGIYLTLGMKKKEIYYLLLLEMLFYIIIATILSLIVFSLTQLLDNLYPYFFYLQYFCLSVLFILFLIMIGWYVIVIIIKHQSIYSLIREEE
ncbi:ABC transporter permease [Ornithinibacillus massiliensis]|uniref:ABC transporter permease n=1 Tax=Ornithinibacillus massiliensis TaxID=1944633 RepID=A0ABS5M970_9BACI|nr:ABC transporter permease [Ornithinibacillus massiliensis]MBS3678695.1 ABC transporter permease [Ornithinibacillus massiliensis]